MSWSTFVVGYVFFKKEIDETQKQECIDELEEALECKLTWNQDFEGYDFQDINWSSHVEGSAIKVVVDKYSHIITEFNLSLYYLGEADEWIQMKGNGEISAHCFD